MLDPSTIGDPDKTDDLKCESCGFYFSYDEDRPNWQSVDDTGNCTECPID